MLLLLYHAVNTTVEREVILKDIWADDGDYIGRTLDVFISKLRKKLEDDTNVKIVNIRGIGYKLVLNGESINGIPGLQDNYSIFENKQQNVSFVREPLPKNFHYHSNSLKKNFV